MTGTLCPKHYAPVLTDGGFEPEVKSIWPISPCVICGEWPGEYNPEKRFVCVTNDTIERARRALDRT